MDRITDRTGPRAAVRGAISMAKDVADNAKDKDKSKGKDKAKGKGKPEADSEVEEGAADGEGGEPEGKKKPPLLFIIIGAVVLVLLIGGGITTFLLLGHKPAGAQAEAPKKEVKKDDKKKDDKSGAQVADGPDGVVFYTPADPILVNIQTSDGRPAFLKLKLTLELPDHATADVLDENWPRLKDMFTTFLSELRPDDLNGSQGSYQLRTELLRRVKLVVAPAQVNAVLIEEMLIN